MRKIIKITESQLREAEGNAFKYIDANDDAKPFNGQSTITAQGKIDGETNAEPIFTDRIGKQRTPQGWARYRMYGNINKPPHAEPTYIFDKDWKTLSQLSKGEILHAGLEKNRIIHREGWEHNIRKILNEKF